MEGFNIAKMQEQTEAFALVLATYYSALIRSGMPMEQAMELTMQFQEGQLRSMMLANASNEFVKQLIEKARREDA